MLKRRSEEVEFICVYRCRLKPSSLIEQGLQRLRVLCSVMCTLTTRFGNRLLPRNLQQRVEYILRTFGKFRAGVDMDAKQVDLDAF